MAHVDRRGNSSRRLNCEALRGELVLNATCVSLWLVSNLTLTCLLPTLPSDGLLSDFLPQK